MGKKGFKHYEIPNIPQGETNKYITIGVAFANFGQIRRQTYLKAS